VTGVAQLVAFVLLTVGVAFVLLASLDGVRAAARENETRLDAAVCVVAAVVLVALAIGLEIALVRVVLAP
jgi:hypothetical protein